MTTYMVALTDAEIGLLRAGLAAHSNLMDQYTVVDDQVTARIARIKKTECRELSARLGEQQIGATEDAVETVTVNRDGQQVILVVDRVENGFDVHAVRSDGDPYATMTVYDAS